MDAEFERALLPLWEEATVERSAHLEVAAVRRGARTAQVARSADRRPSIDLQCQGVTYATGTHPSLEELARAAAEFVRDGVSSGSLRSAYLWLKVEEGALAHERGPDAYVTWAWKALSSRLEREPRGSPFRLLTPLLEACRARPKLRALLPFVTADRRLCFSRTTGAPFPEDCPTARAMKEGRFSVMAAPPSGNTLGEGDAEHAAEVIEARLPSGTGPAVHGTALTLMRRR